VTLPLAESNSKPGIEVPDLLEQSSAWLEQQRRLHRSKLVTYQRGEQSVQVLATVGRTMFELDDGGGALLKVESRDFLIRTADLVLGGSAALPERGDIIREEQDGRVYVFEVNAPGQAPPWRYSDPYRRTVRVHTKQIDQEELP
jgi:hypothetical protein